MLPAIPPLETGQNVVAKKFKKLDDLQKDHIAEILDNGFADSVSFGPRVVDPDTGDVVLASGGEKIYNVRILSYDFPTEAGLTNKINLLRVNMTLEFREAMDNRSKLTNSDIYKNLDSLSSTYAKYFESFSENFSFTLNDNWEYSFNQNVSFTLRQKTSTPTDLAQKAKTIIRHLFLVDPPKLGYLDARYNNFIQTIKQRGRLNESYDSITNSYSFSRSVSAKSGAYKSELRGGNWSADLNYAVSVDQNGSVAVTETANIESFLTAASGETAESLYKYAYDGFVKVKKSAYSRCQNIFKDFVKTSEVKWLPKKLEWKLADNLKTNYVSFGRNINRTNGTISYTMAFTNNPRMHEEAIFEYTISASKDQDKVTTVTESGTIKPYDENKNKDFNPKVLFDKFSASGDVIARVTPLWNSMKDGIITIVELDENNISTGNFVEKVDPYKLKHPRNLISSTLSFPAYGVTITYSFVYSDDRTLRDETYLRQIKKEENYELPVRHRENLIAPNVKETNYDADQTKEGSKSVSFDCVFKRYPLSNKINQAYTDYLKTATSGLFVRVKQETEKSAFVKGRQVVKDDLAWYLQNISYNFNSEYKFSSSSSMGFVDRRGVTARALEY
jgi:hypothetical protein